MVLVHLGKIWEQIEQTMNMPWNHEKHGNTMGKHGKTWKNMDKIIGNAANSGIPHSSESV